MPEPAQQIDTDRNAARETLRVALENLEATGNYSNGAYLAVHPAWKRQWSRPGWSRSHLVRAVDDFTGIEASAGESAALARVARDAAQALLGSYLTHPGAEIRRCAVPELDGDLQRPLRLAEEVMLALAAWGENYYTFPFPPVLVAADAVNALRRLAATLAPAQEDQHCLYAPDNRHQHAPIVFPIVEVGDVQALAAVTRALGTEDPHGGVQDAVEDIAHDHAATAGELVSSLSRLTDLLELEWTPDTEILYRAVIAAEPDVDIFFDPCQEAAYRATAGRLNAVWSHPRAAVGLCLHRLVTPPITAMIGTGLACPCCQNIAQWS